MEKNLSWLMEKFIAHRGFFDDANPENSLGAFTRAIEHNYAIEMEVKLISDGTVVVFNDNELSRMTGQDGYLANLNTPDLPNYKLKGTEYSIPTLTEALALIDGKVPVILNIKKGAYYSGAIESKLVEILKDYKGNFAVMSLNPLTIEWFRKNAPNIARGLMSTKWTREQPERPDTALVRFVTAHNLLRKRAKPDFLAYNITQLPNQQTKKFKKIPIIGWVVNSQEQYLEKVKYVDNIIFENFQPKI